MRRVVWVMVLVMAAVAAPYASAGRAAAQPTTVPFPDFDHDGFGDLAVGVPGEDVGTAVDAGAVQVLYGAAGGLVSDGRALTQGAGGVPGASEASDRFGAAVTALDLNADVYDDLVVGVPGEDLGTAADAGAVVILFGSATGLGGGGRLITQGNPEPGDRFGFSLTGGEVTALDQLVVGAPGEDVGAATDAGAVSLITSPGSSPSEQLLYQGVAGMVGTPERSDAFGSALATGDFNDSDGQDSLAVGVPGEDVGTVPDAGVVDVRYAPGFGQQVGLRQLTQDRPEAGDLFGAALQTGSFDPADGHTDLAVGAPGETVGGGSGAGAVSVVLADASGFATTGSQLFHQGVDGVPGVAEAGDGFGTALSAAGFGDDGAGLAVGAPGEDIGSAADAGVVDVLGNSGGGLGGGSRRQLTQADAAGTVEPGDRFGEALAVFTLESDVLPDLAVGAPGETVGGRSGTGAGSVLFDVGTGGSGGRQFFYQGVAGLGGAPEAGDAFGWAMG
jgi:FG-GAP repeat